MCYKWIISYKDPKDKPDSKCVIFIAEVEVGIYGIVQQLFCLLSILMALLKINIH